MLNRATSHLTRPALSRRLLQASASLLLLALVACEDGFEPGTVVPLNVTPVFPAAADVVAASLELDNVRAVVTRPPSSVIAEQTVDVDPDTRQATLDLRVTLLEETETLLVRLEARSGGVVLFAGEESVEVSASSEGDPISIPVTYLGPGSDVATLSITPANPVITESTQQQFSVSAVDANNNEVSEFFVSWSTAANASVNRSGLFSAPSGRTAVDVTVVSPNGVRASMPVTVVPVPSAILAESGSGFAGPPGSVVTLVAIVSAADNIGVPGVTVDWVVSSGSATLSSSTTTTDQDGNTPVVATLGSAQGPVTVTVQVTGNGPSATFALTVTGGAAPQAVLASGGNHTCTVDLSGAAWCWGRNDSGELGDGTTISRNVPVPVASGLFFQTLSPGTDFTCGLETGGTGYCWGSNAFGQFGNGSFSPSTTPTVAAGGTLFVGIYTGVDHACGLDASGQAFCWGSNIEGQLGDGTQTSTPIQTAVQGGLTFQSLAPGLYHTCGLAADGAVHCWGANFYGQLGDGTMTGSLDPVAVTGGLSFTSLTTGENFTCGMTSGGPQCWGSNAYGELGDGSTVSRSTPGPLLGGGTLSGVMAGATHACAVDPSGAGYCWGENLKGGLGDGTRTDRTSPTLVQGGFTYAQMAPGDGHTCAAENGGFIYCWGEADRGQMGDGQPFEWLAPTPVSGSLFFDDIQAGNDHACALQLSTADGFCWGSNQFGTIGDGTTQDRFVPTNIFANLSTGTAAGPGSIFNPLAAQHTCAIDVNFAGFCWGQNLNGELGVGDTNPRLSPTEFQPGAMWNEIEGGADFTCAIDFDTGGFCWGNNAFGQLGDGTNISRLTPVSINDGAGSPIFDLDLISAGERHACALTSGGTAICWGDNSFGQLGDDSFTSSNVPVTVAGGITWLWIAAGATHTCGVSDPTGVPYCWGEGTDGRIGDGTLSDQPVPTLISNLPFVKSLSAGTSHTCAVTPANQVMCWGSNTEGELGLGVRSSAVVTPQAVAPGTSFIWITAGDRFTCALSMSDLAYCWGDNDQGQLGNGMAGYRPTPVMVQIN